MLDVFGILAACAGPQGPPGEAGPTGPPGPAGTDGARCPQDPPGPAAAVPDVLTLKELHLRDDNGDLVMSLGLSDGPYDFPAIRLYGLPGRGTR